MRSAAWPCPNGGGRALANSRKVSQALQRLARKQFVDRFPLYNITVEGQSALLETFRWALAHRVHP